MIPIHPVEQGTQCHPEWIHLNPLLSYCTRTLFTGPKAQHDDSADGAGRCRRKDCLFSATRL